MPKRVVLSLAAAVVAALPLSMAACSQNPDETLGISTTYPIYTPTVGPGDPRTTTASAVGSNAAPDSRSGAGAAGVTPSSATAVSPGSSAVRASSGSAPGTADTAPLTPQPGTVSPTTTIWPSQPTVTLAPSLIVTMTTAPGVNTAGVDIEGAKKAYYGLFGVVDRAVRQPSNDWSQELAKYAVEPALSAAVNEVRNMAKRGIRAVGHSTYIATATEAKPDHVALRVCNDVTGVDLVTESGGISVGAGGTNRHPQDVMVIRSADGRWFVNEVHGHGDLSC